jgi:hypothetical protein
MKIPIKAPGVSRGIGSHTGRRTYLDSDTIAYAPGFYGPWDAAMSPARSPSIACQTRIKRLLARIKADWPREPKTGY